MTEAAVEPIALADQIVCVEHEIEVRERLYPRWVQDRHKTQEWANRELARMRAVLATLEGLRDWQRIEEHK